MKYEFIKLSPTQNMTLLIKTPVPRADQPRAAKALMDYASVHAEQAGFLEPPTLPGARLRLQMMGGEFCGNAAMCAAAYLAREDGIAEGDIPLEVSGAEEIVLCHVAARNGSFLCSLATPLPARLERLDGVPVVRLPGIAHAILEADDPAALRESAPSLAHRVAESANEDAAGVMLLSHDHRRLTPLVYVKPSDTMVWERGCGSGSAAVAAYAALTGGCSVTLPLRQPGGTITAAATLKDGAIASLTIEGAVRIVAEGTAFM